MNWFDFVILAIVLAGAVTGMRIGLLAAALVAVGGIVGWQLAGRLSDDVGGLLGPAALDTWVTSVAYVAIVVLSMMATRLVWKFARPTLAAATLGLSSMVNRLGGLALGIVIGVAASSVLIVVAARLTYDFEAPSDGIAGDVARRVPIEGSKDWLEGMLTDSSYVSAFIGAADAIPGDALGFVPSDFKIALDILERRQ